MSGILIKGGKMMDQQLSESGTKAEDTVLDEISNLNVKFVLDAGTVSAVNNVNFNIKRGETVCLVGETGAGKSVTAFSVIRLLGAGGISHRARIEGDIVLMRG